MDGQNFTKEDLDDMDEEIKTEKNMSEKQYKQVYVGCKSSLLLHTEFTFDSSHHLCGYDGKCKDIHGHTWFVEIWIKGYPNDCDEVGILFDFGKVKELKEIIDHKLLNTIPPFDIVNPTAENLSMWIFDWLKNQNNLICYKVRIYETKIGKETFCEYGDW